MAHDRKRTSAEIAAFEPASGKCLFRIVRSDGSIALPIAASSMIEAKKSAVDEVARVFADKENDPAFNGTIEVIFGPDLAKSKKARAMTGELSNELDAAYADRKLASGATVHVRVRQAGERHWKIREWTDAQARLRAANRGPMWRERGRSYGLLFAAAVLMFLGFAGFGVWPLAFVGMVPALFVFDTEPRPTGWKFFLRALFFGYAAFYGGFYWVVDTIVDFGGFPYPLAILFGSIFFLYQACQYVIVLFFWRRARDRGFNATLSLVAAFVGTELIFPMLFDHYYGNSFHMLPPLIQVADLGGPMLLTALALLGNGAAYELVRARLRKERLPRAAPIAFLAALALYLGYGYYRIADVEARVAAAPKITIGVVQTNMGIDATRRDPGELHARHIEQSLELEREVHPDLIVWPESSVEFALPGIDVGRHALSGRNGTVHTPTLFGSGESRRNPTIERGYNDYNVAFLADAEGRIRGRYDKTYLLAFGEYIPFGETFPVLYEWSPHTGRFTPGNHVRPLRFRNYRISALVCYEDIVSRFVRRAVGEGDPHLLVNMTNDAWFGDTHEPWVHLALAKFRAVEHHRYLVRATLTGVSAIVDPAGRVVTDGGAYERATLHGRVAMLSGWTPYQTLGDWPGWLALAAMMFMAFVGRRTRKAQREGDGEVKAEARH